MQCASSNWPAFVTRPPSANPDPIPKFFILMKTTLKIAAVLGFAINPAFAQDRQKNTVILDETGIKNLRLETVMVEERDFETTVFAVGRVEVYPGRRAAISSRISGRALEVFVKNDHPITKGDIALIVESRQPGNPPPTIELTAPISGMVSATHIVPGQPVSPDAVLAEIIDLSEVYALARVPENLAGKLKQGLRARISVPAVSGKTFEAELEHLGAIADPRSGTIEAAFHVENPEFALRPGMRAEFEIIVESRPNVLAVPEESLQGDPAERVVYVKDFDLPNAFVRAPIVVGEKGGGWIEVKEGLFPGDEVVTRGSYSLGFVGEGSGMSLKDALDAAHGHEHADDGSELADGAKGGDHEGNHDDHGHDSKGAPAWLLYYAIASSIVILVLVQQLWNNRKGSKTPKTA